MHSWTHSNKQMDKKKLYRAIRLTKSSHPDWTITHGDEAKSINKNDLTLTNKRIAHEREIAIQNTTPTNSIRPIRLNRSLPRK